MSCNGRRRCSWWYTTSDSVPGIHYNPALVLVDTNPLGMRRKTTEQDRTKASLLAADLIVKSAHTRAAAGPRW